MSEKHVIDRVNIYKTVLEVLTVIMQHFEQTFTVCERINFADFVAAKETRPPLSASLSLSGFCC